MITDPLQPKFADDGRIIDCITNDYLEDRPEERVRQRLQNLLHLQYDYPRNLIAREPLIYYGSKPKKNTTGKPIRADIAVFKSVSSAKTKDQGQVYLICETKKPTIEEGYAQLVSYIYNTSADGAIWYNGGDLRVWRRIQNELNEWPTLPRYKETWDAVGRKRKSALKELKDPRGTLRRCHDRIHKRGITDDIALTMVRILLAKWRDEERPGEYTKFYCTPEEYHSPKGRNDVSHRIEALFAEVRDANPAVFDPVERIGMFPDEIIEVVTELQDYRFLGEVDQQWDLMGAAYEQYTADEMKKEGGEYFTNRLIVNLLTNMAIESHDGIMLDPAGGTGGFCTSVLRQKRVLIRQRIQNVAAQNRAISKIKDHIYYIDKKPRLLKIAKAAMIVSGNGHRGFIQANSLDNFETLPESFTNVCRPGKVDVVMTNPPWSGLKNGRITDSLLLDNFEVAHKWEWDSTGKYVPTGELCNGGVPPEYLFVEQCIKWLKPNGVLAIVLPKGILDNMEPALTVRHYLFRYCKVLAIINCHKNTFQPYTGSRGCLVVAQKKEHPGDGRNYHIFMAINQRVGQDSEGVPIYRKDDRGRKTKELDQDLGGILDAWQKYQNGNLKESEYVFTINANDLDNKTLKANPQFFLPKLNETLRRIVSMDGNGFSVERLGDRIATKIWKGIRFKREDLVAEAPGPDIFPYMTPTSIFMRGVGVKYLDLSKCCELRRRTILDHIAQEGEILITRSGTLGRLTIVGASLKGVILSDDLIRIWVPDRSLRALVFAFLRSKGGQDQLLRNEYGTVQQHIEPSHVADVQLPLPDLQESLDNLLSTVAEALEAYEHSIKKEIEADEQMRNITGEQKTII